MQIKVVRWFGDTTQPGKRGATAFTLEKDWWVPTNLGHFGVVSLRGSARVLKLWLVVDYVLGGWGLHGTPIGLTPLPLHFGKDGSPTLVGTRHALDKTFGGPSTRKHGGATGSMGPCLSISHWSAS